MQANRPLTLGRILGTSFGLLTRRFGLFLALQLTATVPVFFFSFVLGPPPESPSPEQLWSYLFPGALLLSLVVMLVSLVASAAMIRALAATYEDLSVSFAEAYGDALAELFPLIWANLCAFVTLIAAAFVLVAPWIALSLIFGRMATAMEVFVAILFVGVPLIYLALSLIFAYGVVVMLEGESGVSAVRRSFELTRGHIMRILGLVVVMGLLGLAAFIALMVPVGLVATIGGDTGGSEVVTSIAQSVLNLFFAVWWNAILVVLYFELREPSEQSAGGWVENSLPPAL